MDFFNKLGDTLSNKGQDVTKKAKEIAEITRLNAQIASCQNHMKQVYVQLGETYFNNNRDNRDTIYEDMMAMLRADADQIEACQKEIVSAKQKKICVGCGEAIANDAQYCPHCGAKNEIIETGEVVDDVTKCPVCGAEVDIDDTYCASCGAEIHKEAE